MVVNRHGKLMSIDPGAYDRVIVLGDIHGDLPAFTTATGLATDRDIVVLLGDYADRGPDGVEVIQAVMKLSKAHPERFVPLKGNHEDFDPDGTPRFYPCTLKQEIADKGKAWDEFFPEFHEFAEDLPFTAIIEGYALLVHAGISSGITSQTDLESPGESLISELLWSDPGEELGEHSSPRGAGVLFGPDVSASVTEELGISHVIRSHQPRKAADGVHTEHDARIVTTSCTNVYGGRPFALVIGTANPPRSRAEFQYATVFV